MPWRGTQWNGNEGDRMKGVPWEAQCGGPRSQEELGCVIKTLIIQSITNAIIGGQADGREGVWGCVGEKGRAGGISGRTRIRFEA